MTGLFVAIPVLAQTTGGQNTSLWETIMALTKQLGGLQQTAATILSTNANVTPTPAPGPTTTTGCGQTLTPSGTVNQTIRCDGTNWVAAGNLLNDGVDVNIGPTEFSGPNFARLYVNNDNSSRSYYTSIIAAKNAGDSNMGISSSVNGVGSIAVFGSNWGYGSVGVEGKVNYGSASSTGVLGVIDNSNNTNTAVKASAGSSSGYGFYQQGGYAKNTFEGNLGLGIPTPTERLEVRGGIKFSYSGNSPVCNDGRRGTLWFNHGGSSGIDSMLVCAKITATSTYAWRNLF